jgi:membrane protease subunit HflC
MDKKMAIILVVLFALVFLSNLVLHTVDERQQVVITRMGKPIRVIKEPGLYIKSPLEQTTVFDDRLLDYDSLPAKIYTKDKQLLVVDNYCKWRIVDPLLFLQSVRDERSAQSRLDDIVFSELRERLKHFNLTNVVSTDRELIMQAVTEASKKKALKLGMEIVDVRIKRADLPPENAKHLFGEMRAERQKQAKKYRSEGEEEAVKIRANTDEEKVKVLATAYQEEQEIKGKGDAEATRIYAEAYQQDAEFYAFIRSLEAYRETLKEQTTLVISPDSEFLQYLQKSR